MSSTTKFIKIFVIVQFVIIILFSTIAYISASNQQYNCKELELVKKGTRQQILNGDHRIGKIQYYREHPGELKAAHKANTDLLKVYAPTKCIGLFGD